MQMTKHNFRELESEEMEMVAGGDQYKSYVDDEGTLITERWSDDGNTFYGLTADYDYGGSTTSSFDVGDPFACFGVSLYAAGGFCVGGGELFVYLGMSHSGAFDIPLDVTVGTSSDVEAYLEGLSIAANGQPGIGVSLNPDGTIASTAYVTGTPGGSITYGVNVSEGIQNHLSEFARGVYESLGSPYDPPADDYGNEPGFREVTGY